MQLADVDGAAPAAGVAGGLGQQLSEEGVQTGSHHVGNGGETVGALIIVALFIVGQYAHKGGLLSHAAVDVAGDAALCIGVYHLLLQKPHIQQVSVQLPQKFLFVLHDTPP